MRNYNGDIPQHLRDEWDAVTREVGQALIALTEAQERHDRVVLPRHEFGGIAGEPEYESVKKELNEAYKRYNASIVARTAIMDVLNRGW